MKERDKKVHKHCLGCGKPIIIHMVTEFGIMEFCWHCYDYYSRFIGGLIGADYED